jgi:Xaa-Pro aminopeptidase
MLLSDVQRFMRERGIDGWLVYDFRNGNPTLARLVPPDVKVSPSGKRHLTRRAMLWIPSEGAAHLLAHQIDKSQFAGATIGSGAGISPVHVDAYLTWQELGAWIGERTRERANGRTGRGTKTIAMEYVPGGSLPVVSMVDAGTIELVRAEAPAGSSIVSSADLIQFAVARWSEAALESHVWASREVAKIKDEAFALIRERLKSGVAVNEWQVAEHIQRLFGERGLEYPDGPIVSANAHGADPHFAPSPHDHAPITRGNWVLIDLWARRPGDANIYSDITWVGYAGETVPERHMRVFETVKRARDAAVSLAQERFAQKQSVRGYELDDASRAQIVNAGYGSFIKHRTGHSLSPGAMVHGVGVNIDNLETHDTRELLPRIGFTVEPGVYIPDSGDGPGFGVRLEINVFVDPVRGPIVTSCVQDDVVRV